MAALKGCATGSNGSSEGLRYGSNGSLKGCATGSGGTLEGLRYRTKQTGPGDDGESTYP